MSEGGVNVNVDVHDSETLRIEAVIRKLAERQGKTVDLEGFRKEAVDRFLEIGFKVVVRVYTTNVPGVYIPDIDIVERLTAFDPDRQVHEVTQDMLELGEGGVIKTGGKVIEFPKHTHVSKKKP